MIKCPECKKDVSETAVACPSCGHPIAQAAAAAEQEKEKLKAKRGCGGCLFVLGVLVLIIGAVTFITARKSASDLVQQEYESDGVVGVAAVDTLAQAAGHNSWSDYLTEQNRNSGFTFIAIGTSLIYVGYRTYKKFAEKKTPHS